MKPEVATEAYSVITNVPECPKNGDHTEGFIKFKDLRLEDLPSEVRSQDIFEYIKYLGNTVVRLTVTKDDGSMVYGSGVVYKVDGKYAVLTNDHVVGNNDDVEACRVDFFYDDENARDCESSMGEMLKGGSDVQDRGFFTTLSVPQRMVDMNMFDNTALMVRTTITYMDGSQTYHNCYPTVAHGRCFVLVFKSEMGPHQEIDHCDMKIIDHLGNIHEIKYLGVARDEERVLCLSVASLPDIVTNCLSTNYAAAFRPNTDSIIPITIAHPHGGPKMVTIGKVMDLKQHGLVKRMYHTARTCPGSSGGLVLALVKGGGVPMNLGFASHVCCHCEGDRMDEYNGVPTETGNLNVSLFNC